MKRHTVAERLKIEDYSEITNHLNGLLKPISKHPLECYVFGSRMYGVATDKSDLNILVDFGNYFPTLVLISFFFIIKFRFYL